MKKVFLLSLVAFAVSACTNTSSTNADVAEASTGWQTEVQTAEMPSTMTQPVYQQPTYQAAAASYNTEVVGNCQVVRDAANKPIYTQITKGCYTDSTYTVGQYDTLYLIGYLTGTNAQQIAALNGISTTAKLKVGSVLRVR